MRIVVKSVFTWSLCLLAFNASAQLTETQGWLFLSHQQKLTSKFDLLADVQIRSANQLDYLTTLLLRGAISYNLNKQHSVAIGYAYKGDWEHGEETAYTHESRVYQQYLYNFRHQRTEFTVRARVEQRWLYQESTNFSQRVRAFFSTQLPIAADSSFSKGWYLGLQNELFLNVQHKQHINGRLFDQNRSLISWGYRFSKQADLEVGYQYWFQQEPENSFRRNVVQVMLSTSF